MTSIKLEPVDPVSYTAEWSRSIKIEEIELDELFKNELPEPEHQRPPLRVEITREAAGPDEIVKEEPAIYDEYEVIESESRLLNDNKTQINGEVKMRSMTPATETQSTGKSQTQTQTKTECDSKPRHSRKVSQAKKKNKAKDIVVKTSNKLPGAKFKCNLCKAVLSSSVNLKRHHSRLHGTRTFQCKTCSKRFSLKYSLQIHQRLHTGLKPFECKICLRLFASRGNLRRHNKSCQALDANGPQSVHKHFFDKCDRFECYICKFDTISSYEDMKNHMMEHAGRKMFRCNICRRMFEHQSNLVRHMLEHTMKKPYECDVCANTFTCSRNLKRHKRLHTRKGLYKCSRCPKEYTTKFSRDAHEKKHKIS